MVPLVLLVLLDRLVPLVLPDQAVPKDLLVFLVELLLGIFSILRQEILILLHSDKRVN